MLINSTNRPITGICQRSRSKDSISRICYSEGSSIDIDEINSCSFWLLLIFLLIFLPASHHKRIVMSTFWLLRIAIYDPSHFLVEYTVVNIGLFWVEIFVKRSTNYTVRVNCDTKLLCSFAYVCIISISKSEYFLSPPSCEKMSRLPPFSTSFLRSSI